MEQEESSLESAGEKLSTLGDDNSKSQSFQEKIMNEIIKYQSFCTSGLEAMQLIINKQNPDENDKKKLLELKSEHEKIKNHLFNMIEEEKIEKKELSENSCIDLIHLIHKVEILSHKIKNKFNELK